MKKYQQYITPPPHQNEKVILPVIILSAGLMFLCWNIYQIAGKYGGWDAWFIWNYHANFMADGRYWTNMFAAPASEHPDYPLCLPALSGFFIRLLGGGSSVFIPFLINILITICIPTLLFCRLAVKNIVIAAITLALVVTDKFYVLRGVSQYADTLLAFFFLSACIAVGYAKENKYYYAISAALLGACIWTKNEGMVLAIIYLLFYAKDFFSLKHIKYTAIGMVLPIICMTLLKIAYAPANDMINGLHDNLWTKTMDGQRYKLIYTYFTNNINNSFYYLKIIFFVCMACCVLQRKIPLNIIMIICCLLCYMGFYVLTTQDLEWHLGTSQDRLIHQLMPAALYLFTMQIAQTRRPALFKKSDE